MDVCRVCLSNEPDKDIYEIQTEKLKLSHNSFADVILFCLDVQITKNSHITTKLCSKCCRKITLYHKFKTLALQSDAFLKSLESKERNEVYLSDDNQFALEIKSECTLKDREQPLVTDDEIKNEFEANDEVQIQEYQSDDELLSVIKNMKFEYDTEEVKATEDKRKRGRPKKEVVRMQVCDECGKIVKNLREHLTRHLPENCRKKHQCERCDKVFNCARSKNQHIRRKHLAVKQHCKECDKKVANLKQHVQLIHNPETLPFKCMACSRRFIAKSVLEQHMTVHTKDRPYPCVECGKRFRSNTTMVLHRRQVHEKEKSHLCQYCSKSFFKKYHLQQHIRTHTKEKPFECPDCGKSFSSTSVLNNHRLIHAEVKMFSCKLCDMTFVRSGYLRAHMLSHTKEKRYPCQYCGVKFHRSDHRRRHEQTHQRPLTIIPTTATTTNS